MEQLNSTTWKEDIIKNAELDKYTGEPKDEVDVIIGDDKSESFEAQIKLCRWSNECNFSVRLPKPVLGSESLKEENGVITWEKANYKVEFLNYTEGEGGHKFIWYLKQKPPINKIEFSIQSKGLKFYYQPELTQQEIDEGAERPENVVGSYAVYHSTKGGMNDSYGKDYKCGKAFHIYRPRIIDAEGKETWGILHIENGIYSVEIPQEFLDTAVYPIKSNDTFGYTSDGGTTGNSINEYLMSSRGTPSSSGDIDSVSAYLSEPFTGTRDVKQALFTLSGTTLTLVGSGGGPTSIESTSLPTWHTLALSGSVVGSTEYFVAINGDTFLDTQYDSGSAGDTQGKAATYSSFPASSYTSVTAQSRLTSIYATYTPTGITTYTKTTTSRARVKQLGTSKTLQGRARIETADLSKLLQIRAKISATFNKSLQSRGRVEVAGITKSISSKARVKTTDLTKTITSRGRVKTANLTKATSSRARMKTAGVSSVLQGRARMKAEAVTKGLSSRGRVKIFDLENKLSSRGRVKTADLTGTLQSRGRVKWVEITAPVLTSKARILGFGSEQLLQARGRVKQTGLSKLLQMRGRVETADLSAQLSARGKIKKTQATKMTARARMEQSNLSGTIQSRGKITSLKSKILSVRSRIYKGGSNIITGRGYIVDVGKVYLYAPATGTSENIPVSFEWYIPSNRWGKNLNFQLQIDQTDDTFADLEAEKRSYQDSGFEYWDGDSWETLPTSGVANSYAGNLVRYITNLTNGLKYWRVRAFAG